MNRCMLQMPGDVRVVVPDSLDRITPYVLAEQGDWFEDEVRFLRVLLRSGERAVDIGANHGVYALSMARSVGPDGHVWAFEPASETADTLSAGVEANGFRHVTIDRRAVSDRSGSARLRVGEHCELNALARDGGPRSDTEPVELTTLDEAASRHDWGDVDFLKLDAEGEEARIVAGGEHFLREASPLVQLEVKAGDQLNLLALERLGALGYAPYRLVPGLQALVPFDAAGAPDGYLLNLFACKLDRAQELADRKLLVLPNIHARSTDMTPSPPTDESIDVDAALAAHARSRDPVADIEQRFAALEESLSRLRALCARQPSCMRLAALARVARDHGARSLAVLALQHVTEGLANDRSVDIAEPFLSPEPRFDDHMPPDRTRDWAFAACLEALERLGSFSSFYTGRSGEPRLSLIRSLGFGSAEMARRLELTRLRFDVQGSKHARVPASLLAA